MQEIYIHLACLSQHFLDPFKLKALSHSCSTVLCVFVHYSDRECGSTENRYCHTPYGSNWVTCDTCWWSCVFQVWSVFIGLTESQVKGAVSHGDRWLMAVSPLLHNVRAGLRWDVSILSPPLPVDIITLSLTSRWMLRLIWVPLNQSINQCVSLINIRWSNDTLITSKMKICMNLTSLVTNDGSEHKPNSIHKIRF